MKKDGKFLAIFFIQTSLGFEPVNYPKELLNIIVKEAPVSYKYLDEKVLTSLDNRGIPASSSLPFAASWYAIIEALRENNPHAASWIVTLIYSEWGFMYWFAQIERVGLKKELLSKLKFQSFADDQFGKEQIASIGTSPVDIVIKWWLDDIILKLRALWDKLPYAIAESSNPRLELKGNRHNARLNELEENKAKLSLEGEAVTLFERLISEMRDIEYIKKHRDSELHKHAKPYAEVFGLYGRHEALVEVWEKLGDELNRCREALIGTIYLILLRNESNKV